MNAGARRLSRWLLALPMVLVGIAALGDPEAPITLSSADFVSEGGALRRVTLPHSWALEGLGAGGTGHYRIDFRLDDRPHEPWALVASRLPSRHAIWLNGALVHATLGEGNDRRGVPVPMLIDVPPALLIAGENHLAVDVVCDFRGGMSPLVLGPTALVQPLHVSDQTWNVLVPQTMNVVATGLALLMLTIWWRRPAERELGLFCGLMVAVSLRNVLSTGSGNQWHSVGADYTLYLLQVVSVALLCRFSIAFSGRDARWLARTTDVVAVLLIAGGAVVARVQGMAGLREVAYPALLALIVPSLWLLGVGARRTDRMRRWMLSVAITLLAGAALHDYFFLRGLLSVMHRYWMPFVSPFALLVFAWTLLDRLVAAFATVETLAVDLERRVAERTSELQLANAAKTRFLAAASHDLRQPVLSISLLTDLMRQQSVPPAMAPLLQRIGDSVQALNALLKGLLDLSRFDAHAVRARMQRVALRPMVESVVQDERLHAQGKGLSLRTRVPNWAVESDPVLLEQILRNLLGNAVRYTERGGVLVVARRRGDAVRLEVWDTGPGIAPESQALVFEEFVQLDNPARERSRGLGLGLSLVRRAASVLGVEVTLRSQPGRGSRFAVELPFAGAVADAIESTNPSLERLEGWRIWLVEDDPGAREATRLCLHGWGADVRVFEGAVSCEAAMEKAVPPDLLITDQRLPDGSGVGMAARLHVLHPDLPVLLVTGDTAPQDLAALKASGLPVLHKPYGALELHAALRDLRSAPVRSAVRAAPPQPRPVSAS